VSKNVDRRSNRPIKTNGTEIRRTWVRVDFSPSSGVWPLLDFVSSTLFRHKTKRWNAIVSFDNQLHLNAQTCTRTRTSVFRLRSTKRTDVGGARQRLPSIFRWYRQRFEHKQRKYRCTFTHMMAVYGKRRVRFYVRTENLPTGQFVEKFEYLVNPYKNVRVRQYMHAYTRHVPKVRSPRSQRICFPEVRNTVVKRKFLTFQ